MGPNPGRDQLSSTLDLNLSGLDGCIPGLSPPSRLLDSSSSYEELWRQSFLWTIEEETVNTYFFWTTILLETKEYTYYVMLNFVCTIDRT